MREIAAKHPKTGEVVQCFTVKLSPSGLLIVFHNDDGEVFKLHRYGWPALVEAVQAEITERRVRAQAKVAAEAAENAIGTKCSACGGSGLIATPVELLGDPLECPACAGTGIRQNDWQESD